MSQAKPLTLNREQLSLQAAQDRRSRALWQDAVRYLLRDRLTMLAVTLLSFLTLLSFVGAPVAARLLDIDYTKTNTPNQFQPPNFAPIYETSWTSIGADGLQHHVTQMADGLPFYGETEYTGKWGGHILGTDNVGRDQFVRLLYGGQVSLLIAIITSILSLILGVALGLLGGYFGGILDDVLVWFITTVNSIPGIFLLIVTASLFGQDPRTLILILVFYGWLLPCRLVRGEVISLKQREYILAALAVGAPRLRILAVHLLPNVFYIAVVSLSIHAGTLILIEAGLSFLGLGVAEPQPTWGNMLSKARSYFTRGQYLVYWPGIMITMTVLSLYLLGDGIRDALDPRTSRR
ncbi:MAG: ABC transporter permease [Chloroflexi bacterium]|nr:ABC transporter permease [Chloroflexota bacterium]